MSDSKERESKPVVEEKKKAPSRKVADPEIVDAEPVEPGELGPDIVEDAEGEEEQGEGLLVALSRRVGAVARTVSDGLHSVSHSLSSGRSREQTEDPTADLLHRLGSMVSAHEQRGYASLAEQPEFWQLVSALSARRVPKIMKRKVSAESAPRRRVRRGAASPPDSAARGSDRESPGPSAPPATEAPAQSVPDDSTQVASDDSANRDKKERKSDGE